MSTNEDTFGRLVSLAVHDLRTPLATIVGFARMLQRTELGDPNDRYVEMLATASDQLTEILEDLSIVARIESARWEPNVQEQDSLELAREAAEELEGATVSGSGATVRVDADAARRALYNIARGAQRHGGLAEVRLEVEGATVAIAPITADAAPVVTRERLRDLGAALGARVVVALGGSVELVGDRLLIRLPT